MYIVEYQFTEKSGVKKQFTSYDLSRGDADQLIDTLKKMKEVDNVRAFRKDAETLAEIVYEPHSGY